MSDRLHISVMLGGPSAEREVSLRSGAAVIKALRSLGHTVDALDPRDDSWTLAAGTEIVFLALHGTYGEDGTVQRHLEALGLPFTGCDSDSSRIAFDKVMTKKRCLEAGVPTARFAVFTSPESAWPAGWQPPVVLSPCARVRAWVCNLSSGSRIGTRRWPRHCSTIRKSCWKKKFWAGKPPWASWAGRHYPSWRSGPDKAATTTKISTRAAGRNSSVRHRSTERRRSGSSRRRWARFARLAVATMAGSM